MSLPLNSKYQLYDHQREAIQFMTQVESKSWSNHMRGGILHMTMGLGKSLISVAHSLYDARKKSVFPTLIITTKSLVGEWKTECFEKFFDETVKVLYFHKDHTPLNRLGVMTRQQLLEYNFVVTTYDVLSSAYGMTLVSDQIRIKKGRKCTGIKSREYKEADDPQRTGLPILYYTPWRRIIADESQKFANPKIGMFEHVMGLYGDFKWCLTGTPVRNSSIDLWSQLRFCGFDHVMQASKWALLHREFIQTYGLLSHIHTVEYKQTDIELDPLNKHYETLDMSERQRIVYNLLLTTCQEASQSDYSSVHIFALFSKLRQCAISPYLLRHCFKGLTQTDKIIAKVLEPHRAWLSSLQTGLKSPKILRLVNLLKSIPSDEKVLIFSSFRDALKLARSAIEEHFPEKKLGLVQGDVDTTTRSHVIDSMKKGDLDVLLMSYKIGSHGFNLTEASHVLCLEEWWCPEVMDQAVSRCHRQGQTKPVHAYHFVMKDTIEERCVEICERKVKLQSSITKEKPFKITTKMLSAILV